MAFIWLCHYNNDNGWTLQYHSIGNFARLPLQKQMYVCIAHFNALGYFLSFCFWMCVLFIMLFFFSFWILFMWFVFLVENFDVVVVVVVTVVYLVFFHSQCEFIEPLLVPRRMSTPCLIGFAKLISFFCSPSSYHFELSALCKRFIILRTIPNIFIDSRVLFFLHSLLRIVEIAIENL